LHPYCIKIDAANRAFVVLRVQRYDKSGYNDIDFKVDTGADRTTISPKALLRLGYDLTTIHSLMKHTGSGSIASGETSRHFSIDLSINHIIGQIVPKGLKFPFICKWERDIPYPKPDCNDCELAGTISGSFRSLLGNDILSCFDIAINRNRNEMEFKRIADLTSRNMLYPECELFEYQSN
jgi:hypothetical protein